MCTRQYLQTVKNNVKVSGHCGTNRAHVSDAVGVASNESVGKLRLRLARHSLSITHTPLIIQPMKTSYDYQPITTYAEKNKNTWHLNIHVHRWSSPSLTASSAPSPSHRRSWREDSDGGQTLPWYLPWSPPSPRCSNLPSTPRTSQTVCNNVTILCLLRSAILNVVGSYLIEQMVTTGIHTLILTLISVVHV